MFLQQCSLRAMVLATCLLAPVVLTAQSNPPSDWERLMPLLGTWIGEGGGDPGQGVGSSTFTMDLQNSVMVRKSHTSYPAANGRPAFDHDDLMIIYRDGGALRAFYVDNEGHSIRYDISVAGDSIAFVSPASENAPRFRLSYVYAGPDRVRIYFEIAPPGQPDAFREYVTGSARKQG